MSTVQKTIQYLKGRAEVSRAKPDPGLRHGQSLSTKGKKEGAEETTIEDNTPGNNDGGTLGPRGSKNIYMYKIYHWNDEKVNPKN